MDVRDEAEHGHPGHHRQAYCSRVSSALCFGGRGRIWQPGTNCAASKSGRVHLSRRHRSRLMADPPILPSPTCAQLPAWSAVWQAGGPFPSTVTLSASVLSLEEVASLACRPYTRKWSDRVLTKHDSRSRSSSVRRRGCWLVYLLPGLHCRNSISEPVIGLLLPLWS